ncbi:MAG TPA: prephenate dehydrogenase/arogenate dehydrogenase family protein [Armatimonadota bacterium]
MFNNVAVIGMGLLGGSVGIDVRQRGLARRVLGVTRRAGQTEAILASGAVDEVTTDWAALSGADLIVMAAPVSAILRQMPDVARWAAPEAIVTDLGSTKAEISRVGEAALGGRFVPGHPMAGSHEAGIAAARAGLFVNATWVFTPSAGTDKAALEKVMALAAAVGARPTTLDRDVHDRVAAAVSHMPHLASAALSLAVSRLADGDPRFALLAGGGLRDMTRLAASPANLWRDIFATNRDNTRAAMLAMRNAFDEVLAALEDDDSVEAFFDKAGAVRKHLVG